MNLAGIITSIKFTARNPDTDKPLSFGKVYTYEENSSTPKTTWKNETKSAVNTNPIILDAYGQCDLFLDGNYRIVVKDVNDTLIDSIDNIRDAASTARDFANELITAYNQLTLDPEIINSVAENLAPIIEVRDNLSPITTVSTNIANVNINATNIAAIITNANNITDIQNAEENAIVATEQAATATEQAVISTTKANEANTSAISANNSAETAATQATIATEQASSSITQAGISATKAEESASSANEAELQAGISATAATQAALSANEALEYRNQTQAIKESIEEVTAIAITLGVGENATASFDTETNVLSLGIPQGPQGIQGPQGPIGDITQESVDEIIGTLSDFTTALG